MDLFITILPIGILWGAFHFWGLGKRAKEVLSNPNNFPSRTVHFYEHLTFFPKALLSFFIALACWFVAKLLAATIHLL